MKTAKKFLVALMAAVIMVSSSAVFAQTPDVAASKTRQRLVTKSGSAPDANSDATSLKKSPDPTKREKTLDSQPPVVDASSNVTDGTGQAASVSTSTMASELPDESKANRFEQESEEAAVVPYYNNFFNTYRLGPEDVISVNVFGQDRYSRSGIIIPPSGRISLTLIPGGVFVNGKTVEEVAEAIKKRYDEYIIEPQVSVSLDKASSYRYSVIGDVAQPGIRLMNRRMTVTEALGEAGGVLATGNRSKVVVLRKQANGNLASIPVNVSAIYRGKAPDTTYLVPGDQVIVPGNKLKSFQKIMTFFPILSFARIFTGGVF
jgi:protein involved in polysaccharide export with SLBB domain